MEFLNGSDIFTIVQCNFEQFGKNQPAIFKRQDLRTLLKYIFLLWQHLYLYEA